MSLGYRKSLLRAAARDLRDVAQRARDLADSLETATTTLTDENSGLVLALSADDITDIGQWADENIAAVLKRVSRS